VRGKKRGKKRGEGGKEGDGLSPTKRGKRRKGETCYFDSSSLQSASNSLNDDGKEEERTYFISKLREKKRKKEKKKKKAGSRTQSQTLPSLTSQKSVPHGRGEKGKGPIFGRCAPKLSQTEKGRKRKKEQGKPAATLKKEVSTPRKKRKKGEGRRKKPWVSDLCTKREGKKRRVYTVPLLGKKPNGGGGEREKRKVGPPVFADAAGFAPRVGTGVHKRRRKKRGRAMFYCLPCHRSGL